MKQSSDDKIKNVFSSEFPDTLFDVFSENGQVNEHTTLYTVFFEPTDWDNKVNQDEVLEFAKSVFDEVFFATEDEHVESFFGVITGD
jgi:hypothetical protein